MRVVPVSSWNNISEVVSRQGKSNGPVSIAALKEGPTVSPLTTDPETWTSQ